MYRIRPSIFARLFYSKALFRMPSSDKKIYLTFDDGPTPEVTPTVLAILKQYNVKATFFCVGHNVQKHPDIYHQIISEGHAIGNHTFNHVNGWNVSTEEYQNNTQQCATLVDSKLFRPPYGKMKWNQYRTLSSQYKIVMWDVISGDFDAHISADDCYNNVINNTRPGSVIVFHDSIKAKEKVLEVLPKVLEFYSNNEFLFHKIAR